MVGFRNLPAIQRWLGALEASTYRDFEILICENGGDQAFSELVHALPSALPGGQPIRAVKAPGNVGYAGGVNIGMKETATASAWWILIPDTLTDPDALAPLSARRGKEDWPAVGRSTKHT